MQTFYSLLAHRSENTTQLVKYPRELSVTPSNKVYVLLPQNPACDWLTISRGNLMSFLRWKPKFKIIFKGVAKMLITLSSLTNKMQRSLLSKDNEEMSFVWTLFSHRAVQCARYHASIILKNVLGSKLSKFPLLTDFTDVCNFEKLQKGVLSNFFFLTSNLWHEKFVFLKLFCKTKIW